MDFPPDSLCPVFFEDLPGFETAGGFCFFGAFVEPLSAPFLDGLPAYLGSPSRRTDNVIGIGIGIGFTCLANHAGISAYIFLESRQRLVLSCLVLSCLVLACLVLSCLVLSCLVLPCLVLSGLVLVCLVLCLSRSQMLGQAAIPGSFTARLL